MMALRLFPLFGALLVIGWSGIFPNPLAAQDRESYIHQYQDIAISEMHRTGIPASIKLAQGILESNCGMSDLAREANNHFGIKCGGTWNGGSYEKEDDDYRDGVLVPSCFRTFNSAMECYVAHSDFLMDPRKAHRYGPLFRLDPLDYKGWAHGLSKAGYATDPQYAHRLIRIIEQYQLYRYDEQRIEEPLVAAVTAEPAPGIQPKASQGRRLIREVNGVSYMTALAGDRLSDIALQADKKSDLLLRYNDGIYSESSVLPAGARIFLQNKKSTYKGNAKVHKLKAGESMADLAQHYGIRLPALLKRNGLRPGQQPAAGQKVYLKGKPDKPLRTADPYQRPDDRTEAQQAPVVEATTGKGPEATPPGPVDKTASPPVSNASASPSNPAAVKPAVVTQRPPAATTSPLIVDQEHIVAKGDTLYGIARRYGISVDDLKKINNLPADTIVIGQKLVVK